MVGADLKWLAVSSDYARQGIGTLLLRWGLDLCEKEGVPACLDSTVEAAQTFYQKAGFTERGRISLIVNGEKYEEIACVYEPKRQTRA
jgi:predicted N-acetyltransferase YhbS